MKNSFDFENMVRYYFVNEGTVTLPTFLDFKPGETLVFLKNNDISMTIVTKKDLDNKVKELQEKSKEENEFNSVFENVYQSELQSLYDSIITTSKVKYREWDPKLEKENVCYIDLDLVKYFLSEPVANGIKPVVFKHDGKYLVMYYGSLEYKNRSCK